MDFRIVTEKTCAVCKQLKPIQYFRKRISKERWVGYYNFCEKCKNIYAQAHKFKPQKTYSGVRVCDPLPFTERKCYGGCKQIKPVSEFYPNSGKKFGLNDICKACCLLAARKHSKTDKGKFNRYKCSSARLKREFQLSFEQFVDIIHRPCFYCGEENDLGIDRKNNNIGYILLNCLPCCYECNKLKMNGGFDEFVNQITKIYKWLNK